MKSIIKIVVLVLGFTQVSFAASQIGRLGIGMSNHLVSGMDTFSLKLQRNRSMALGGSFGLDSSSEGTYYALGLKVYRMIYEEPQLNFYSAFGADVFTYKNTTEDATEQGYQLEGLFGTEFSFQGLESVGWSFEFGAGFSRYQGESRFKTVGHSVVKSAVHFYL